VDIVGGRLVPRSTVVAVGGEDVFTVLQSPAVSTPPEKTYAEAVKGTAGGRRLAAGYSEAPKAAGVRAASAAAAEWEDILAEYPGVTQPFTIASSPTHGVQHQIITQGRPVTAKFCRLDPNRLAATKEEFSKMLAAGVVRRSSS
jgi:hypothetical protein